MTSNDVRDVLNLPSDSHGTRPSKKQKVAAARPNLKGLAREVQNLGGDTPIAIVPEVSLYKKRRLANRKPAAKWELRQFKNSAREDPSLVLRHWKRKNETEPNQASQNAAEGETARGNTENGESAEKKEDEIEDSAFAKFNVKVNVPEYNDEQYEAKLQSTEWTKDETDYLMRLVTDFDLRWPLIWDRYEYLPKQSGDVEMNGSDTAMVPAPKPRTMEDLKARYYEVAAKMMEVQKAIQYMTQSEFDLHQMMMKFNPDQELKRKHFALNSMSRSKDEAKEEESLLIEVKRIMARSDRFNEERRELYQRLDYPHADSDISAYKGSAGLHNLLTNLQNMSQAKKQRKTLTGPEGASPAGAGTSGQPASAVSEAPSRGSIAAQSAGHRDSIGAEKATPASNKKGQPPPERRKLSEYEEQIYGVSTHERLSSGPSFRYERVNKLFSHKSGQQQQRIQNVLSELDIPIRLSMPTATVMAEYEKLVVAVTGLIDLKKQSDKLNTEIKIEEAKKAERAKARAILGLDGTTEEPLVDNKKAEEPSAEAQTATDLVDKAIDTEKRDPNQSGGDAGRAAAAVAPNDEPQENKEKEAATNVDGEAPAATEGQQQPTPLVKEEEDVRPNSSGGGGPRSKRSASVLSTTSDKSAKRQKK